MGWNLAGSHSATSRQQQHVQVCAWFSTFTSTSGVSKQSAKLSRGEITIWALTPVFLYFYHFPSYPHVAQRSEHSLAVLFSNNIAARRCVLPGRFKWRLNMFKTLSFNMLKHLRRASVLRFPRRRTLNPKTLNHPKP